jgi:hypothetical protein
VPENVGRISRCPLANSNQSDVSTSAKRPWYRHLGSTIAIVLGLAYFAGSINPSVLPNEGLIAGPVMVLGALSYRSAKRRALGEATASVTRQTMEAVLVLLIVASVVFRNDLGTAIVISPAPTLLVPVWCVVAYLIAAVRARRHARRDRAGHQPKVV